VPDEPKPPLPVPRLDRAALERVLARAAELQVSDTEGAEAGLTEEQLVDVGREVGLSPQHLRQALAEERGRAAVPAERGTMARLFGAAHVHASRTLNATVDGVFSTLDAWLQREDGMQVKRRLPDRMTWEPRSGFFVEFRRWINVAGHGYHLARAQEVAATAVPLDGGRVVVRLDADLSGLRRERVSGGGLVAGGGVMAAGVLVALGFFAPIAVVPAALGLAGGYAVARSHAPHVVRAQLALEQLLDRLERGEQPRPGLLSALDIVR